MLNDIDIYLRYSDDAGATWQAPVKVSDGPAGSFQFLPGIAIDVRTGNVDVGWYNTRTGERRRGAEYFVATSQDQGASFSPGQRVNIGPSNAALLDPAVFDGRAERFMAIIQRSYIPKRRSPFRSGPTTVSGCSGIPDRPQLDVATAAIGVIDVRAGAAGYRAAADPGAQGAAL